jgi:hypothetical protein
MALHYDVAQALRFAYRNNMVEIAQCLEKFEQDKSRLKDASEQAITKGLADMEQAIY